ncbi:1-phosphofructokinase [Liquorilactobacillus mali]|uniref:Tagatose-6-phosphate kinase n=1 Tax=Liquorilactobacillus mali KCTC 3596 = DSM 20444 TaxID=1046596 RepID=A0A0R2E7Q4_9LACO|nr:1-phosphofructokinase [Liquorilactobacillus mali]KRN09813.1 1-phosphofructokinase [Liquorilactobacillus mali KCTC 3596 = DSM 20444]MDC7954183.1 1-phosphofructokinase [Liquorilactobacillus mali]QFQ75705.1 1-phosphofructokinase [Liquorilactobacillus mali]
MIYTITLNPAIDLFIDTERMEPNMVNRTKKYDIQANGKGINVSFILKKLNLISTALGVGNGFTAKYIQDELQKEGILSYFTESQGITRINVFARVNQGKKEYKLVNPGPTVKVEQQEELLQYLVMMLKKDDVLCISGSFSQGIDPEILTRFAKVAASKDTKVVIDTSYPQVMDILGYHPWILKPNEDEIKTWFNISETLNIRQLAKLGQSLVVKGAQIVLISLGNAGALLVTKNKILYGNAPKIETLNTAGAGDSMLGTFIGNMVKNVDLKTALKRAIAAGSDAARREWITDFSAATELEKEIQITDIIF